MAYTAPTTRTTGDLITASIWNTDLTDNIAYLYSISESSYNGWVAAGETWVYATASTFTISGDKTARYKAGVKLKFAQTTAKYAVVMSAAYTSSDTTTTVTIAVNTDYVIADAAISTPYFSYSNPADFPDWFACAGPTFDTTYFDDGAGGQPTTEISRYRIDGRQVTYKWAGTGYKAGTDTIIFVFADTYLPGISRTTYSDRQTVGHWMFYSTAFKYGTMFWYDGDNNFWGLGEVNVSDNVQYNDASFQIIYEI